ncbi:DEKNAAC100843 [Brettanomyces naardenensis]|uniref:triacylglycerol lipase n=1 Tax=Brettanomyces naardenensis TaxID=13370 RepID=A0A448YEU7_BRENA|nr:DEKNAAC100843 [Brettanomyces naardenensis]
MPQWTINIPGRTILRAAFELTYRYAIFSAHAYCPKDNRLNGENAMLNEVCDTQFCQDSKDIKVLKVYNGEITYLILEDSTTKQIILSFKGTSSPKEWAIDTNYRLTTYNPSAISDRLATRKFDCNSCKVHRGFLQGYSIFHKESLQELLKVMEERGDYKLYVVGHSLGGAIAQIAAIEFYLCGLDPIIINYGSPKVMDYRLSDWMTDHFPPDKAIAFLRRGEVKPNSYFRVTTSRDIVPMLPPYEQGFSHSGYQLNIYSSEPPVLENDLELAGSFDRFTELSKWKERLSLLKKNYKKYIKNPMSGYKEFVQIKYHRYYYLRMGCSYAHVKSVEAEEG